MLYLYQIAYHQIYLRFLCFKKEKDVFMSFFGLALASEYMQIQKNDLYISLKYRLYRVFTAFRAISEGSYISIYKSYQRLQTYFFSIFRKKYFTSLWVIYYRNIFKPLSKSSMRIRACFWIGYKILLKTWKVIFYFVVNLPERSGNSSGRFIKTFVEDLECFRYVAKTAVESWKCFWHVAKTAIEGWRRFWRVAKTAIEDWGGFRHIAKTISEGWGGFWYAAKTFVEGSRRLLACCQNLRRGVEETFGRTPKGENLFFCHLFLLNININQIFLL
jgi:hypothetical protein